MESRNVTPALFTPSIFVEVVNEFAEKITRKHIHSGEIEMLGKEKDRRRTFLINKPLQHRLIKDVCRAPMIAMTVGMILMALSFRLMMSETDAGGVDPTKVYIFIGCMSFFVLLAYYMILRIAILISNRIAGPVYRLHKAMEQLHEGDMNCRINLREGDYLSETARMFNHLADSLAKRIGPSTSEEREAKQRDESMDREKAICPLVDCKS